MNTVASGLRAHVDHGIPDTRRLAVENLVVLENAEGEYVHQRVAVIAGVEHALPAHRRNAETVAVVSDAGDNAFEDPAIARRRKRAEAQRVHYGDGPRAHGENVAQNAADARGRALEWL